jgi:glucose-6-phosphate isomerase
MRGKRSQSGPAPQRVAGALAGSARPGRPVRAECPARRLESPVRQCGKTAPDALLPRNVAIRDDQAGFVVALRQHDSPRIDDHRAAIAGPIFTVLSTLGRRENESLIFDRSCAQQNFPVVLAGLGSERARDRDELGRHLPVEFGESHVVTNREPDRSEFGVRDDHLVTRRECGGLREHTAAAVGQIHIKQMDLAIHRLDLPVRRDQHTGVVEPVTGIDRFRERAGEKPHAMLARKRTSCRDNLTIETLRAGDRFPLSSQERKIFWQTNELCTACRGGRYPMTGGGQVGSDVVCRSHLNQSGAHGVTLPCTALSFLQKGVTVTRQTASRDIHFEAGGSLAPPLGPSHGVSRAEVRSELARCARVLAELLSDAPPAGFVRALKRPSILAKTRKAASRWRRRKPTDLIHIGIGGSSLGAEALLRALAHPQYNLLSNAKRGGPRVHFVDNVDPQTLGALLEVVDLRKSLVHVVSKSGGTVETAAGFQIVRDALTRAGRSTRWQDHCVFTTGHNSALFELARREGVETLDFPEDVGGRFSVLTPSGLFTPAVAGVDVAGVVGGARRYLARVTKASVGQNPSAVAAAISFAMAESKRKPIQIMMPYADALEPLSRWYVQLVGESLGKRAKRGRRSVGVGPTPLPARGTTDQHSQVQLFVEGPSDKWLTFVSVDGSGRKLPIAGGSPADYLEGVDLGELLRAEQRGTAVALAQAGRPTANWRLPAISPDTVGQLFFALELQTAFQGALFGINAYDQPGVEAGKLAAFALIGREGYADTRKEIEALVTPAWTI